ncbi:MAG: NAD(+)/NADH kinase [Oscillospiraceae bacterium]|jgi:NAD+ kinase|nr:NAD(+)/NADH kinase [Oscillospiraceae bacterium]
MTEVILCPNPARDLALVATDRAAELLRQNGFLPRIAMISESPDAEYPVPSLDNAALVVAFGGDGTVLRAARIIVDADVPLIGVNMGGKGFLAELEPHELDMLPAIADGAFTPEPRLMLDLELQRDGETLMRDFALNDCVIAGVAKVISLEIYGDERHISRVVGDGVVIATPTGSTAYSLAAGGPVVEPTARNIIVTPICAHALAAKPYVLSDDRVVTVDISSERRNPVFLSVDGREPLEVRPGDRLIARRSVKNMVFAHISERNFYGRVSEKLGHPQ